MESGKPYSGTTGLNAIALGRLLRAEGAGGANSLLASTYVIAEIREIHFKTPAKYGITAEQTDEMARAVMSFSMLASDVPEVYRHPYDPDDSHYVNLAVKVGAQLIVSRDRHLLMLADTARSEGREFQSRFPFLRVLDPVQLLRELDSPS
ncbi:MAG TPA: hypothetical protein VFC78_21160 [Tepidisphaeraceae bacterium]|nr:hypothetical protein [Tepidisphaeraceae bacterium]